VLYTRGVRGRGRVRLATREDPPRAWLLEADGEALRVRSGGEDGAPTVVVDVVDLGLLVYGRATLAAQERAGRAQLRGDRAAADILPTLLGNP
jgi:hypothetical protein